MKKTIPTAFVIIPIITFDHYTVRESSTNRSELVARQAIITSCSGPIEQSRNKQNQLISID
jgi:hypothetical protein